MRKLWPLILGLSLIVLGAGYFAVQFLWNSVRPVAQVSPPSSVTSNNNNNPYNITHLQPKSSYTVTINQKNGGYTYTDAANTDYPAGEPLILAAGKPVTIRVNNQSATTTNVHWHGLTVPNSQDGPSLSIADGTSYTYQFTPTETGTYWYHSHYRPVDTQVGEGMYGPLVVKTAADAKYSLDQILMLGNQQSGNSGSGMMGSSESAAETVNGATGSAVDVLTLSGGQIAQLRFINVSTSETKQIDFPFEVRVTHKDGYALSAPYNTRTLTIAPGGRADVEVALSGAKSQTYEITGDGNSFYIPIVYEGNNQPQARSPFVAAKAAPIPESIVNEKPDIVMSLGEGMGVGGMDWTINGQIYPQTGTYNLERNKTYKIEFDNSDSMMGVTHPIHIHGAHFQVVSINGKATNDETWYDTYPMAAGTKTDIAISFSLPGVWVVHCHILAHEDGGMMASFTVK